MLQDIWPRRFDISFRFKEPEPDDIILFFHDQKALLRPEGPVPRLPSCAEALKRYPQIEGRLIYLFSIDELGFFLFNSPVAESEDYFYQDIQEFRRVQPSWLAFGGATASHLAGWYEHNRYCGKCAGPLAPSRTERALNCENCGRIIYPSIAPVVIVAIVDGEKLLMTRYARGIYRNLALVAGFMEVGETIEDAVRREVREEVGLEVANIRYYRSQPWAFSQSMLVGLFADLAGSAELTVDQGELSEALWLARPDIPPGESSISLTYEMIEAFRGGRFPK